jgi:PAS domain S-box-containing protein
MMILDSVLPLFSTAIVFSSGVWVLGKFPKRQLARLYFLLCLLGSLWGFSLFEVSHGDSAVAFWHALGSVWLLVFPVQLHFVFLYSEEKITLPRQFLILQAYFTTLVIIWLFSDPWGFNPGLYALPLVLAIGSIYVAASAFARGSANRKREQELFILLAIGVGLIISLGVIIGQLMELEIDYLFPLLFSVETVFIAIALVRHELIQLTPFTAMESIMSTLTDAVILTTSGGKIVTANRAALDILGYKEVELVDQPIGQVIGQVWKGDFLPGEDDFGIEMALIAKDKKRIPVTLSTSVVSEGISSPQGIVFVARDLTKRVHAQEQLVGALKEKEILLKETHHRVKNNLQVISSLLSIQKDFISDPEAKRVLDESRDRVYSMAVVHELLYQSQDLREIDFKDYTNRLIEQIVFSHNVNPDQVSIEVNVSDISLDLDTASYIGLAINELLVNALVHGFPDDRVGEIWLSLVHTEEGEYVLAVTDNGVGLPADFNLKESDSLGLLLVSMVAEQVGSELVITQEEGTTFLLTFNRLDEIEDD